MATHSSVLVCRTVYGVAQSQTRLKRLSSREGRWEEVKAGGSCCQGTMEQGWEIGREGASGEGRERTSRKRRGRRERGKRGRGRGERERGAGTSRATGRREKEEQEKECATEGRELAREGEKSEQRKGREGGAYNGGRNRVGRRVGRW